MGAMDSTMGMAGMGMGLLGTPGRDSDEEKARKLQMVIDILKSNNGRVSEEGVERLARRNGLECLWEDQMGSSGSVRTLIIAGTGLSIDIDFTNNLVGKVSLSFPESPEIVTKHAEAAGRVLLDDLQLKSGESPLTKMLDKFATNLERLATLDKLSVLPALNCYEAIAGIYESLQALHTWELKRLKEDAANAIKSDDQLAQAVLRTKSGKPSMNAKGQVGLSLNYWEERLVGDTSSDDQDPKTWSMIVECAPSSSLTFPPVRVTTEWISKAIEQATPQPEEYLGLDMGPFLDWQNPENVMLPGRDMHKDDVHMEGMPDVSSKAPDVMFVAKFSPPLAISYSTAMNIYMSTGATMDSNMSFLDALLLPPTSDNVPEVDGVYRRVRAKRTVRTFSKSGEMSLEHHHNTLTIQKAEYGYTMTALPFTHPRQLVEALPILRQYALLSSLLDYSFASKETESQPAAAAVTPAGLNLADFLKNAATKEVTEPTPGLPVDVTLLNSQPPSLRIMFPFRQATADIAFEIGLNGSVKILAQNVLDKENDKQWTEEKLGRLLEATENLDTFAAYLRCRLV